MARSIFSGQYGHNIQLEVISGWNQPNQQGNFSIVNVQVKLISNPYGAIYGPFRRTLHLNIGGIIENVDVDININTNQTQLLYAKDHKINHDPDGRKSISITAKLDVNVSNLYVSATATENLKLADINVNKASTGTDIKGVIGKPIAINITRSDPSYKHAIWVTYGSYDKKIAGDNVDTSISWIPDMILCNETPNATSGFGTITYITYKNGVEIGRDLKRVELTVPDNIKPTLGSITLKEGNTSLSKIVTGNNFVRILSSISVNFVNAQGNYSSTISSYHAEIVNKQITIDEEGGSFGSLDFSGQAIVRATVTDSRGRVSEAKDLPITVLDYYLPQISFEARRAGTNQDEIQITRNVKIAPLTVNGVQKNVMKLKFKVAPYGSNIPVDDNGPADGTFTTVSSLINSDAKLGKKYDAGRSYTIYGFLEDLLSTVTFKVEVATRTVSYTNDQQGMGILKIREQGALDVGGDIYANNRPIQQNQLTEHNGNALSAGGDWNNYITTGFYMGFRMSNSPPAEERIHQWIYVRVTRHNDQHVLQEAVDFNGLVNYFRVKQGGQWKPWKKIALVSDLESLKPKTPEKVLYKTTIPLPYGMAGTLARVGDTVTLSLERRIITINQKYENARMVETIPEGYRPVQPISLILHGNVSQNIVGTGVMHLNADGVVALTNSYTGTAVWLGTATYVTTDPNPS